MLKKSLPFVTILILILVLAGTKQSSAQELAQDASATSAEEQSKVEQALNEAEREAQQMQEVAQNAESAVQSAETAPAESETVQEPDAELSAPLELKPETVTATTLGSDRMTAAVKTVKSIDIIGNKSIGIAQVLSKIKTRVGQDYQEQIVSDDLKRLYNTGHFSDVQIDHEDFEGGYKVIVRLKEKAIVDALTFSKLKYFNKRHIESKIKTKKDKFLDNKTLKEDINTIEEMYKKKGLTQVKVDVETFSDETTNKVSLHFIIREGFRMKIKRINVYGNTAYRDKKIIKAMKSRPAWLFNSGFLKEDELEEDMGKIQAFYGQNGYIDCKATYKVDPLYKGLVNVDVSLEEGKRYYVGDVSFSGNAVLTELDIKTSLKNIREGNVFSREKLDEDVAKVRNAYFDKGYISAIVDEATSFNTDTGKVDIKLSMKEGNVAYIDKIKIQGNTTTRDIVIRRELRMYPGDQFDGQKLRKSKERLKNLGYFEDVGYDIEDTEQNDLKDLIVQVKEAKTGSFSFGGGYSTVDKLVGFIELEQKNFDIANWPSFTGGGQDLRIRGEIGSLRQNFLLSFTEPSVFDYPFSAGFDAYLSDIQKDDSTGYAYDEKRVGGDIRVGKNFNDHLSGTSYYKLEQIEIDNMDSDVSADLAAEEGTNLVSSTGVKATIDHRDSPLGTTKGFVWNNGLDLAGGMLGGDKDFYRLQTSGSYFVPVRVDEYTMVLELRGKTGVVQAYGDSDEVPIFERYFAGGERTIRGYNERKVGPLDPITEDPIGGEAIIVGTAEYTVPIIDILKAAVFFDSGNVWADASDYLQGGIKNGAGLGLRVKTPIGPLNLDYGIPLNDEEGEEERSGKFYFSVSRGF